MRNDTAHIALDRMTDLLQGNVPPAEQQPLNTHIAGCATCATQVKHLSRIVELTRSDALEEPPDDVVARARRLMRQRKVATPSLRQRISAALTFDSVRSPAAFGVRTSAASARQIIFSAGDLDIEVRLRASGTRWIVAGQVLTAGVVGQVALEGPETVQSDINALGEWSFEPVPAGPYMLSIRTDDLDISMVLDVGP